MSSSAKTSAGLLPYRVRDGVIEVFIAHMGGPFWARKDARGWSIVKGEYDSSEEPLEAARREFAEETGQLPPAGEVIPLGQIKQSGGKLVSAWAVQGDIDPEAVTSNTFTMEWPPHSGRQQEFPEIDRAAWVTLHAAREKLVTGQVPLIDALERELQS
jgi:predicted NUDIX family NTP pyrophosphohydrolase